MKKLFILICTVLLGQYAIACTTSFTTSISGSTVTFTNMSSGPSTGAPYSQTVWAFGDGGTSTSWATSHTYSTSGTYHVMLIVNWYDSLTHSYICGDTATDSITIGPVTNTLSGTIYGDSTLFSHADTFKVWLITYDSTTHIIGAIDSQIVSGLYAAPYSFSPVASGSYFVKAKMMNGPSSGTGLVPTYYSTSIYWSGASYATVTSGILSGIDIYMQTGTVTTGPGFVSGNVLYGAGKTAHTTGTVGDPVKGLLIFLRDGSGNLVSSTYTDASGNYSFSNLPTGSYNIYPEDMGYATTPSPIFDITTTKTSVTDINFKQNSTSIYPAPTAVANVSSSIHQLSIYPNPGNGIVNVSLTDHKNINTAKISINNITGQQVYNSNISFNTSGYSQLDLSGLQAGIYFVNVVTNNNQYTQKLVIQH